MDTYTLEYNIQPNKWKGLDIKKGSFEELLALGRELINPWQIRRDSDGVVLVEHEISQVHVRPHTQEPWRVWGKTLEPEWDMNYIIVGQIEPLPCCQSGEVSISYMDTQENAERAVACVNFCKGYSNEQLKEMNSLLMQKSIHNSLRGLFTEVRDECVQANKFLTLMYIDWGVYDPRSFNPDDVRDYLREKGLI